MNQASADLYLADTAMKISDSSAEGDYVERYGEIYYRIRNYDQMSSFFMSVVSSSDHWLFISSTGGLSAGRIDADNALFPYETDDKITAGSEQTGSKTIIHAQRAGRTRLWEPFSNRYAGLYDCERHLYKNVYGNKLIFEEINHDLQLIYRYAWRTGDRFGFIRSSWLENRGADACHVQLLDGMQNILPYGASAPLQSTFSNLLNGYKRNELDAATGLGIFALSATLTDRAEPSESLMATVAWQIGLEPTGYLLSNDQLDTFRRGGTIHPETDVRGRPGAYLINATLDLSPGETRHWHIAADVNQDGRHVANLVHLLGTESTQMERQLEEDIDQGTETLVQYVASADGLQMSADDSVTAHHYANVLFNIMRGGIFINGYDCSKADFVDFVETRNRAVYLGHVQWFDRLPDEIDIRRLHVLAAESGSADLVRLCYEYLPLIFSRRHGDPSRPWNRFSINLRNPDGTPRLDYQGNWRDIFQNWEPMAISFPGYVEGMIAKFLNATTADGYNPYRITRDGIEWEVPEPDNPWANIGYWSDHQIIYLQKLLEIADQTDPDQLSTFWNRPIFAYADVPYRLHPYSEMLANWYDTIDFDWESERKSEAAVAELGTDGRLRLDRNGAVIHVSMTEKLLTLLLAKLTNLVPEGGIWMNTQRPEWNDANNALVGKGLSVVTTAYLRRFIAFWLERLAEPIESSFAVSAVVVDLMDDILAVFDQHRSNLATGYSNRQRRHVMDALGEAVTAYRAAIYQEDGVDAQVELSAQRLRDFLQLALAYIDQTLRVNRRSDDLYHAYNILRLDEQEAAVDHLYVMLEGQVAMLSSGLLSAEEALVLLRSLRNSDLYRADQHTYMLYPNRELAGFLTKNVVPAEQLQHSELVNTLSESGDTRLLVPDIAGNYHFHGSFRNAGDVAAVLELMAQEPAYADLIELERGYILDLFEATFNHRAFTGRSGTFFAFEGLGSIYWHMVAKLLLAVQECYEAAIVDGEDTQIVNDLATAYYDIRQGIGFNKSPVEYGAFPTDPYSHTPWGSGARQPGMTGQVKEEILTRWGELGVSLENGVIAFSPSLLEREEFLSEERTFRYWDVNGEEQTLLLPAHSLAFTLCQTPVIYTLAEGASIEITYTDGHVKPIDGHRLEQNASRHIVSRDNRIRLLRVTIT